jgi:hypothetical protein
MQLLSSSIDASSINLSPYSLKKDYVRFWDRVPEREHNTFFYREKAKNPKKEHFLEKA